MNDISAFRAEAPATEARRARILVWDAPVRVAHWLMVISFSGAYLSAESERWRLLHVTLGYTLAALVLFRIVWGLVGTRHARFANFVRGPKAAARYLAGLLRGKPEHYTGHNPAGALAILALLGLALGVAASGWALYNELGTDLLEEVHEVLANLMLALVGLHIAAVLLSSWLHRENLVAAMIDGRKRGTPPEAIRSAWRSLAVLMLAGVVGFGWLQWQSAPAQGGQPAPSSQARDHGRNHD